MMQPISERKDAPMNEERIATKPLAAESPRRYAVTVNTPGVQAGDVTANVVGLFPCLASAERSRP